MRPKLRGWATALVTIVVVAAPLAASAGVLDPCPTYPGSPETTVECFDDLLSGSAASAAAFDGMSVIDGLVLSESDAAFLLGLDTEGWATSGEQGVLNALLPVVDFLFDASILLFRVSVVALPGPFGEPVPVVVQGYAGDTLVATAVSDVSRAGEDGVHDDWLGIQDGDLGFDRVRVFAALGPCDGPDCEVGATTSFFADTVKFIRGTPRGVPEPGGAALALTALTALAGRARRARRGGVR